MRSFLITAIFCLLSLPAFAVQPDEVLDDPALESRAREISRNLRCPVCQGESIDDSNAGVSRDLRLYVRERLVAGDSNAEVIDHVTDRYGEFVLFEPRLKGANWILYLAGPIMAALGLLIAGRYVVTRGRKSDLDAALSADEESRLKKILERPPQD